MNLAQATYWVQSLGGVIVVPPARNESITLSAKDGGNVSMNTYQPHEADRVRIALNV